MIKNSINIYLPKHTQVAKTEEVHTAHPTNSIQQHMPEKETKDLKEKQETEHREVEITEIPTILGHQEEAIEMIAHQGVAIEIPSIHHQADKLIAT